MAKEYENYVFTEVSGQDPTINLFVDLADAFEFQSVSGTNNDKTFVINSNVSIRCVGFVDMISSTSTTDYAYIYVVCNEVETEIYKVSGYDYTEIRQYRIIQGTSGDVVVQLGKTAYDKYPNAGICLAFAIVNVQNTIDDSVTGYGVYVPYSSGNGTTSGSSSMNATPRFLITEDTLEVIQNQNLTFISTNSKARIVALVPICSVASECVTTSSFVMMMGNQSVLQGRVKIEAVMYYCIGGFFMLESTEE